MKFKTYEYNTNGFAQIDKIIEIDLPNFCCGKLIEIDSINTFGANYLKGSCRIHISGYRQVWENFGPNGKMKINTSIEFSKDFGLKCISCNTFNQYAETNQSDGTYKCYECRV